MESVVIGKQVCFTTYKNLVPGLSYGRSLSDRRLGLAATRVRSVHHPVPDHCCFVKGESWLSSLTTVSGAT